MELDALLRRQAAEYRRGAMHTALLCTITANINRDSKARPQPYTLEDFLPDPEAPKPGFQPGREMSVEEMKNAARMATLAFGGVIRKRGEG